MRGCIVLGQICPSENQVSGCRLQVAGFRFQVGQHSALMECESGATRSFRFALSPYWRYLKGRQVRRTPKWRALGIIRVRLTGASPYYSRMASSPAHAVIPINRDPAWRENHGYECTKSPYGDYIHSVRRDTSCLRCREFIRTGRKHSVSTLRCSCIIRVHSHGEKTLRASIALLMNSPG